MQKKTTQKKKRFKITRRFFRAVARTPNNLRRQPKIATKLYGLGVLKRVCQKTGSRFLQYKIYSKTSEFSLADLGNPKKGRILVRTDPEKADFQHSVNDWGISPRMDFAINSSRPEITQREIKEWMKRHDRMTNTKLVFVVHKVPDFIEYKDNIRINVDLRKGVIEILKTPIKGRTFRKGFGEGTQRHSLIRTTRFFGRVKITERQKAELIEVAGSEKVAEKVMAVVTELISFGRRTNQPVFETSAVTYTENPEMPEFYDLLFGKRQID